MDIALHVEGGLRIYIAGPYSKGDVVVNVRDAIKAAEVVLGMGHTPYVPHLSMLWHMVQPHSIEFWYEYDLRWLRSCDAVLRLPGESTGADKEVAEAERLLMPVFHSVFDIPERIKNPNWTAPLCVQDRLDTQRLEKLRIGDSESYRVYLPLRTLSPGDTLYIYDDPDDAHGHVLVTVERVDSTPGAEEEHGCTKESPIQRGESAGGEVCQ